MSATQTMIRMCRRFGMRVFHYKVLDDEGDSALREISYGMQHIKFEVQVGQKPSLNHDSTLWPAPKG